MFSAASRLHNHVRDLEDGDGFGDKALEHEVLSFLFDDESTGSLENIGVFNFPGGLVNPELEVTATGESFVALGDPGPWASDIPVAILLESLYYYVSQVMLERFEPLLGPRRAKSLRQ